MASMQVKLRVMVPIAIFGDGVQNVQVRIMLPLGAALMNLSGLATFVVHRLIQHADG